jgi:phosphoglycolate phosphatase
VTVRVLLFDIDGTLLHAGGAGQAAMEQALAVEFGVTRPVENIPTAGRTDCAITRDLFAFHDLPLDEGAWTRFLNAYFARLPEHLCQRPGAILPGVRRLLDHLAQQPQVVLGLLTGNFAHSARLKLEHYGLARHFTFGGYGDHHHDRDDVARLAVAALRERHPHVPMDQVWVIGDTPADIRCGRAVGANTFAVATGLYSRDELALHQPDVLAETLEHPERWLPTVLGS